MRLKTQRFVTVAILLSVVVACENEEPAIVELVPAVKVTTVAEATGGQRRQISGTIEAADTATLSFAVGGTVLEVLADVGQGVTRDQVLARLDPQTYRLNLDAARARLTAARADLVEQQDSYTRQKTLFDKEIVAKAALDKAAAGLTSARSRAEAAESDVAQALRDFERTALTAPYAGIIAERLIEPFQETTAGATIFVLQDEEGLEVEALVPESMIREVAYGDVVTVTFPTLKDITVGGVVGEIGRQAEAGNAFPVTINLAETDDDLRPGMSARIVFDLARADGRQAFLIPLSAIATGEGREPENRPADAEHSTAPIFVFDEAAAEVRKRDVQVGDLRGNLIEVYDGLQAGDKVVVAGVAFLRHGMKARLWAPSDL